MDMYRRSSKHSNENPTAMPRTPNRTSKDCPANSKRESINIPFVNPGRLIPQGGPKKRRKQGLMGGPSSLLSAIAGGVLLRWVARKDGLGSTQLSSAQLTQQHVRLGGGGAPGNTKKKHTRAIGVGGGVRGPASWPTQFPTPSGRTGRLRLQGERRGFRYVI